MNWGHQILEFFHVSKQQHAVDRRVQETSKHAEHIADQLSKMAETPNPISGESDPFGALVHAVRNTYHRKQLEKDGFLEIKE